MNAQLHHNLEYLVKELNVEVPHFFRSLREWELESVDMFLDLLYANNLPFGMEKIVSVGGFLKMEGPRFILLMTLLDGC